MPHVPLQNELDDTTQPTAPYELVFVLLCPTLDFHLFLALRESL